MDSQPEKPKETCSICKRTFETQMELDNHIKKDHGRKLKVQQ